MIVSTVQDLWSESKTQLSDSSILYKTCKTNYFGTDDNICIDHIVKCDSDSRDNAGKWPYNSYGECPLNKYSFFAFTKERIERYFVPKNNGNPKEIQCSHSIADYLTYTVGESCKDTCGENRNEVCPLLSIF